MRNKKNKYKPTPHNSSSILKEMGIVVKSVVNPWVEFASHTIGDMLGLAISVFAIYLPSAALHLVEQYLPPSILPGIHYLEVIATWGVIVTFTITLALNIKKLIQTKWDESNKHGQD